MVKVATSVEVAPDHLRFLAHFIVETRVRVIPLQCMHLPLLRHRVTAHAWKGGALPTCKTEDGSSFCQVLASLEAWRYVAMYPHRFSTICGIHKSILRTHEEVFYFLGSWHLLSPHSSKLYCLERYHMTDRLDFVRNTYIVISLTMEQQNHTIESLESLLFRGSISTGQHKSLPSWEAMNRKTVWHTYSMSSLCSPT